ncbi:hypothetical protein JCM14076_26160 [Methylosoma difficile]
MYNADPVCSKSFLHDVIQQLIDAAKAASLAIQEKLLIFRNSKNPKNF